jgi:hypothetical protein
MARILPIQDSQGSPLVTGQVRKPVNGYNEYLGNMNAILGYSQVALDAYIRLYPLYAEVEKILGKRLAALYAYTISMASECTVCAAFFRKMIGTAHEHPHHADLTDMERDLLEMGKCIVKYQRNINDRLFDRVSSRYSKAEMVTLVAFAGQMIAAAVFNNVIETDIHENQPD